MIVVAGEKFMLAKIFAKQGCLKYFHSVIMLCKVTIENFPKIFHCVIKCQIMYKWILKKRGIFNKREYPFLHTYLGIRLVVSGMLCMYIRKFWFYECPNLEKYLLFKLPICIVTSFNHYLRINLSTKVFVWVYQIQ